MSSVDRHLVVDGRAMSPPLFELTFGQKPRCSCFIGLSFFELGAIGSGFSVSGLWAGIRFGLWAVGFGKPLKDKIPMQKRAVAVLGPILTDLPGREHYRKATHRCNLITR